MYKHAKPVSSVVSNTDTAFTALLSRMSIPAILFTVGAFLLTTFKRGRGKKTQNIKKQISGELPHKKAKMILQNGLIKLSTLA